MSNSVMALNTSPHDRKAHESVASGFAIILRDRTAAIHREAERTGFIADLIRAKATRAGYALFLRNLVPVYEALEAALDAVPRNDSIEEQCGAILSPFADHRLRRLDALRSDLRSIAGPAWETSFEVLSAARGYVEALRAAAESERLAAHGYARYLGDLSGGQILKPVLSRTLGLRAEALTFYEFPMIPDLAAPKAAMRAALDRVDAGGPAAEAIVEEAIAAFRHNISLSAAVQAAAD